MYRDKATAFNKILTQEEAGAISWYDNTWHYYQKWEHLLEGKSLIQSGYPFKSPSGEVRIQLDPSALPKTADWLSRALTIPINIHMDDRIPVILKAIEKAAAVL